MVQVVVNSMKTIYEVGNHVYIFGDNKERIYGIITNVEYEEGYSEPVYSIKFNNGDYGRFIGSDCFYMQEAATSDTSVEHIYSELVDTYKRKNHDYGNAFSVLYKELGFFYAYGVLKTKMLRIQTLKDNENMVEGETMEDSILDLANYCVMTVSELRQKKNNGKNDSNA